VIRAGVLQLLQPDDYPAWQNALAAAGLQAVDLRPSYGSIATGTWDPKKADVALLLGGDQAPDAAAAHTLWWSGVPLFTQGAASDDSLAIIVASQATHAAPGVVRRVPDPLPGGWSDLPSGGAVCRQGVTATAPGSIVLARDSRLGYIGAVAWNTGRGRWVHLQEAPVPPAGFLAAVIPWLAGVPPRASYWWAFAAGGLGAVGVLAAPQRGRAGARV
jgi:hypothetical protein